MEVLSVDSACSFQLLTLLASVTIIDSSNRIKNMQIYFVVGDASRAGESNSMKDCIPYPLTEHSPNN